MRIILIVAMTPERFIGRGGKLPWHDSEDLKHFKRTTMGHAIIMGRRTWGAIGKPLPGRRNIVLTRGKVETLKNRNVETPKRQGDGRVEEDCGGGVDSVVDLALVSSLEQAIELCRIRCEEKAFIIGGAQVYEQAIPLADEMIVTWMEAESQPGDTLFPEWNPADWSEPQIVDPQFPRAVRYSRRVPRTTE